MRRQLIFILSLVIVFSNFVFASDTSSIFYYGHTKGKICAEKWSVLEKLIITNNVRCKELKILKGFPYLRGNIKLLTLAEKINTKYSKHKWLELLRRADLQARYIELDLLPKSAREKFCKEAGINCFTGRVRAYVARCSAIMMGDEKRNHDYLDMVLKSALDALKEPFYGQLSCFNNPETLDGLLNDDTLVEIFNPTRTSANPKYLNKRIQSIKNMAPKY